MSVVLGSWQGCGYADGELVFCVTRVAHVWPAHTCRLESRSVLVLWRTLGIGLGLRGDRWGYCAREWAIGPMYTQVLATHIEWSDNQTGRTTRRHHNRGGGRDGGNTVAATLAEPSKCGKGGSTIQMRKGREAQGARECALC
jgi:hypothetical protein